MSHRIDIPELCLVILIGPSGSGKSTFARRHFLPSEVVSSDQCRATVDDDENSLSASDDAFELLHFIVSKRLKRGKLTVVDATNVRPEDRQKIVALAREHHVLPVGFVFNVPLKLCQERNEARSDRDIPPHVIRNQHRLMKRSLRFLRKEGFRQFLEFENEADVDATEIARQKLYNNQKHESGPFDIIGDVHGCNAELVKLFNKLGYKVTKHRDRTRNYGYTIVPPAGRKAIFVGDLTDRGPGSNEVLRMVMSMVSTGDGFCVCGNHDQKLHRRLSGKNVKLKHGLAETMEQLATEPDSFIEEVKTFLNSLISHYLFDDANLVVAHAGLTEEMQGRTSGVVRSFCLYGETTGEIDEFGLPVRYNWAKEYKGKAMVVYGHTPVPEAEWLNNTIDIDTGCVFGGKLTALRYPERELVSVKPKKIYHEPVRPLHINQFTGLTGQHEADDLLYLEDVLGKRAIETRLRQHVTVREENSIAALEVMSRFAINPKWLVYLPPTMSPTETSALEEYLEHPAEVFDYFQRHGVDQVVCQEKHMGSRTIVVICKDEAVVKDQFGVVNEGIGKVFTRTGREFFNNPMQERELLQRLRSAMNETGFWSALETEWAVLDCELMPWSAKAQQLISKQYAAVGAASGAVLPAVEAVFEQAANRGIDVIESQAWFQQRNQMAQQFTEAYKKYCWPVETLDDYRLAPFHIMATEGAAHIDKDHMWHMRNIRKFCETEDPLFMKTEFRVVQTDNPASRKEAQDWWEQLTAAGGEGMVIKPRAFVVRDERGLIQPAIKCRGREYLRIIYGPDYTAESNMQRLKRRGLSHKRSLAAREFALGIEGLERFVRKEPLRRVHECVFGVLALESEPVDPRL